jgi:hypothetical protein
MLFREISSILGLLTISLVLPAGPVPGQDAKRLSAREIFYSPPVEPPAAKKAPAAQAKQSKEQKPAETAAAIPANTKPAATVTKPSASRNPQVIPAAYSTEDSVALGLRYSILKREGSETTEVKPDTAFHSGDRIRLRVEVNTAGYLYIINRGSSGNWNPLFPSPKIAKGDNRVQKAIQYEIPAGYVFTFDEQPGTEKLFIVFSRRPVSDLEELIYSLTGGQDLKTPPRPDDGKILLAQAKIEDRMVDRFRNIYSRDLIIEKVDETIPAPPAAPSKENAVYVVNPSKSADARVVADVTLIHK